MAVGAFWCILSKKMTTSNSNILGGKGL